MTNINWYPGHMAKTKRQIQEKKKQIDLVIEIVDSRTPMSSKLEDLETYIGNKPRIMIMTKKDLCDLEETNKWVKYFESLAYKVLVVDLNEEQNLSKKVEALSVSLKEEVDKKLKNKSMLSRKLRALVVGVPNSGKSTFINRMSKKKVVNIGNRPGVTKQLSWIRVNDNFELLDSPGLLWPKFKNQNQALALAASSAIKEEILPLDEVATYILNLYKNYYPKILEERYKVDPQLEIIELYDEIAKKRGCIYNGETDYDKVIMIIINDIKAGRVKGITFDRYDK